LINHGASVFEASAGDRIAQLLIVPFLSPSLVVVDELPPGGDDRGPNGFGSSGR
jgi:dUTP pyrophosphatase